MVYKFFDKKSSGSGAINKSNVKLANELHKPLIKKFSKRKVYSSFKDNIWGVDLADMQKGLKRLLMNRVDNQTKFGLIKEVSFTIKRLKTG